MSNLAEKLEPEGQQPPADTALVLYQRMLEITVKDQETYGSMAELVKQAKEGKKAIEAWFKPLKESAQKAHKDICAKEKESLAPYVEIETSGQSEMNRWLNEEHKRQQEREREEREKAAAEAEREREELAQSAAALESLGDATGAAALRQQAEATVPPPVFAGAVDRTVRTGAVTASAKKELVVEVTDKLAFLRYLVEKGSACAFVEFKASELKAWARSNGFKPGEIPGLHIEERLASAIR